MKKIGSTIIIIAFAIAPHTIVSFLSTGLSLPYQYALFASVPFLLLGASDAFSLRGFGLMVLFSFLAVVSQAYAGRVLPFNVLMPYYTYIVYEWMRNKKFNYNIYLVFIVGLIVYVYYAYFSKLPSFFFRGLNFDEDALFFDNSSSNSVSMGLIMTLLFGHLLLPSHTYKKSWRLLTLLLLVLVLIQGSRLGLIVMVFYALLLFKLSILFVGFVSLIGLYIIGNYLTLITHYIDNAGGISFVSDGRFVAFLDFFGNMNFIDFFLGNESKVYNTFSYTYNFLLDCWDNYTVFGFVLLFFIVFQIVLRSKERYVVLLILLYGFFESNILPMYWDAVLLTGLNDSANGR